VPIHPAPEALLWLGCANNPAAARTAIQENLLVVFLQGSMRLAAVESLDSISKHRDDG
jgi:hypothetical protein